MDLKRQEENFKNHVATFVDYGNIKILDFKNPNSSNYRIRFLFEEDYYKLHISGDLRELTATNCSNMTYEKFSDFVNNIDYFKQKIDCHDRNIYIYDEDLARKELEERAKDYDWLEDNDDYFWEEDEKLRLKYIIDDVLEDFSSDNGIGPKGQEVLEDLESEAWEYVGDIGKRETGILDLYMLAFKLAKEQLEKKSKV